MFYLQRRFLWRKMGCILSICKSASSSIARACIVIVIPRQQRRNIGAGGRRRHRRQQRGGARAGRTTPTAKMKKEASQSSQSSTLGEKLVAIGVYSLCSSSMLVVNKLAVAAIPLPTVVSGAQLVSSAAIPLVMQACGAPVIGKMTAARVVPYALYTTMFAAGLFANMKALLLTNVGAVIAARCCLPLIVSAIEYSFMGRSWPNKRSMVSLVRLFFFTHVFRKRATSSRVDAVYFLSRSRFCFPCFGNSRVTSPSLSLCLSPSFQIRVASSSSPTYTSPKTRASLSKAPRGLRGFSSGGCFWHYK